MPRRSIGGEGNLNILNNVPGPLFPLESSEAEVSLKRDAPARGIEERVMALERQIEAIREELKRPK